MGLKKLDTCFELSIHKWSCDSHVSSLFPGLSRVVLGYLSMLPGSGGLKCDIGSIGDIVALKRSRLSLGMVEAIF